MKVNDESTQYQAMWLSLLQATGTRIKVNEECTPQQREVIIFFYKPLAPATIRYERWNQHRMWDD